MLKSSFKSTPLLSPLQRLISKKMPRKIRPVPCSDIVRHWLRLEYESREEFKRHIDSKFSNEELQLIYGDSVRSPKEADAKRYEILKSYREFIEWLKHAEWWEAILDARDILELMVIH